MELEEEWEEATEVFEQPRSYVLVRCPVVDLSRVQRSRQSCCGAANAEICADGLVKPRISQHHLLVELANPVCLGWCNLRNGAWQMIFTVCRRYARQWQGWR